MGEAAGNVFQGQSRVEREGFFPPSLSLSLHMWLSVDVSPTHSDRLCFPCRVSNGDWLAFSATQHRDRRVKTGLNFSF